MKEKMNHAIAKTGEVIAKLYSEIAICLICFHEPVMPESMRKRNREKELWKRQ